MICWWSSSGPKFASGSQKLLLYAKETALQHGFNSANDKLIRVGADISSKKCETNPHSQYLAIYVNVNICQHPDLECSSDGALLISIKLVFLLYLLRQ